MNFMYCSKRPEKPLYESSLPMERYGFNEYTASGRYSGGEFHSYRKKDLGKIQI